MQKEKQLEREIRSWERIPAARELAGAGLASPSLRGPAPVGRPGHRGDSGHRPLWGPRAGAQRPGRRNRPLQPATRAGLSGVRLHVNIITRHQKQNPKSRLGAPNKKHIVRFPTPSFGRSHVCAPAATPPAKSMTSVGRNPSAPHHVRAPPPGHPAAPRRRVPAPGLVMGPRQFGHGPFPTLEKGADGTQVAPEWVILIKGPSSVWLVERLLFLQQFDTLFSYPHPPLWGFRSHPPLLLADLLPS